MKGRISRLAFSYLQEYQDSIPELPTSESLEILCAERQRELERQREEEQRRLEEATTKYIEEQENSAAMKIAAVMGPIPTTSGCAVDFQGEETDPSALQQRMELLIMYIKEAEEAKRYVELAALQEFFKELEAHFC